MRVEVEVGPAIRVVIAGLCGCFLGALPGAGYVYAQEAPNTLSYLILAVGVGTGGIVAALAATTSALVDALKDRRVRGRSGAAEGRPVERALEGRPP